MLLLLCPLATFSQIGQKGSLNISTGVDLVVPSSSLATTHNVGAGVTLKSEYVFARHVSATVAASFYRFPGDEADNLEFIPLLAGLRYYTGNFYIGAEAGTGIDLNSNKNGFNYVFSIGDEIIIGHGSNSLDVSIRIHNWNRETTQRFYGLRVAYEFRIR